MITEDFVMYETAKLLKEKGFNEPCLYFYDTERGKRTGESPVENITGVVTNEDLDIRDYVGYLAPTQALTMKWLREKYNYQIIVTPEYGDVEYMPGQWQEEFLGWKYTIIPFNGNKSIMYPSVYSITAESAYEAAIKYCLENLI